MSASCKMGSVALVLVNLLLGTVAADSPPSMRLESGITEAISAHVHVIPSKGRSGVPNVGIIVGTRGVLIVDSGLGKANGEVVLREAQRLAKSQRIYVTATHFHPEHLGGEAAFPEQATIIRTVSQQAEIETDGMKLIELFRGLSADNRNLLEGFHFREPDLLVERELAVDLGGGVVVQLVAVGPAHTNGDMLIFVPGDGVLFTGDVTQQHMTPMMLGSRSTAATWLKAIDRAERLGARILVPSHGEMTTPAAFKENREVLQFLQARAATLKASGSDSEAAASEIVKDYKARFGDWKNADALRMSMPRLLAGE
jgi:glyoxylase-like metal-dependent hydrolase (beta-lactamase superfamily II)